MFAFFSSKLEAGCSLLSLYGRGQAGLLILWSKKKKKGH